jgi:hypothetical protein
LRPAFAAKAEFEKPTGGFAAVDTILRRNRLDTIDQFLR